MATYRFRRNTDNVLPQATLVTDFQKNAIYATSVSYGYETPPSKVNVEYSQYELDSNIRITIDLTTPERRLVLAPSRAHDPADDNIVPTREEIIASYYKLCSDDPQFQWQTPAYITHFVACDIASPEITEDALSFICLSNTITDVLKPFFESNYSESGDDDDDESTEFDDRMY